ncbi:MAG TPA: DNA repair exonuclease [Thermomicrobiaceae bacterium]|nr:DNA repair exonuclease [Thermomicrobiaceae bacterium]
MRVLCAGDLHIGRRSSRIPAGLDGPGFASAAAWDAIVDAAVDRRVDLLALSGDVVDRANRYFEALGPLERGLRRLAQAGIPTVAVAGNHDFDVLPRLVDALPLDGFHLLGRGGRWERRTVAGRDGGALHVDGWSFPQEHVLDNPLDGYAGSHDGLPVLGLLHADLDQPRSVYAPVPLAGLREQPVALWLLGHLHAPRELRDGRGPVVLYPGTPQALDPGEPEAHGAWLAELEPDTTRLRRLPISSVEYQPLAVDLTGVATEEALQARLADAVRGALQQTRERPESARVQCVCCRLTLTGRTPLHRRLRGLVEGQLTDLELALDEVTAVVEHVDFATRPALELARIAARNDPPGEVARLIQGLASSEIPADCRAVVTHALEQLQGVRRAGAFADAADDPEPTVETARSLLLAEAWTLLDTLMAQREEVRG